ncbi:MAG: DUF3465 domain-containing protein [Steroidobacter sp.]
MRFKGTLTEWKDDRGFGFIEPAEGGQRVFCHIKAFDVRVRRPMAGDRVTYEITRGPDGRTRAERVRPVGLEEASYQSNMKAKSPRERVSALARSSWMSRLIAVLIIGIIGYYSFHHVSPHRFTSSDDEVRGSTELSGHDDHPDVIARAFSQHQSHIQVQGSGVVERILPDDTQGSQHQRFVVRLASGQTVLIAHNTDLASRVASLAEGDRIQFCGEYEWNAKGGVIHWTHHDPNGHHQSGWIRHNGITYQ